MINKNIDTGQSPVPDQTDQQVTPPISPTPPEQPTSPKDKKRLWVVLIIFTVLVVGGLIWYGFSVEKVEDRSFNTALYRYETRDNLGSPPDKWDQQIVEINKQTGEEVAIVDSVKVAVPELQRKFNLLLKVFAQPDNSDLVYFKSVLVDTDNLSGALYSFDTRNKVFNRMNVNKVYDGFFGGFALSLDQKRFVWIPDAKDGSGNAKVMYLINLLNDDYKILHQLSGNETFNGGYFAFNSLFKVRWLDNNTISYSAYDQSKKREDNLYEKIFIEERQLTEPS